MLSSSARRLLVLLLCAWRASSERGSGHLSQMLNSMVGPSIMDVLQRAPKKKKIKNMDRLTCLREDDLDLVKPLEPRHAIRKVIPIGEDSTTEDVYLSVDNLWLKHVSLVVTLKRRKSSDTFLFEVTGTDKFDDGKQVHDNVANVDFWIHGVDILLRNSWMDWGSNWVADRQKLAAGQNGHIWFKLFGEGRAVMNEETGEYEVELISKHASPFKLDIENQWILEKLVNSYGQLDSLIIDKVFNVIAEVIPDSLAASFKYVDTDELWTEFYARVTGKQSDAAAPLKLNVHAEVVVETVPNKVLAVFLEHFDAKAEVERRMSRIDLQALWENNKETLAGVLKRYGVKLGDYVDEEDLNLTKVKADMLEAVRSSADELVQALQPFLKAFKPGSSEDFFEGLRVALGASVGWDASENEGRIKALLSTPQDSELEQAMELPRAFVAAVGKGALLPPPEGEPDAVVGWNGLSYSDGELLYKSLHLQNVRLKAVANGTQGKAWKLGGTIRDLGLRIPKDWEPDWEASWPNSEVRIRGSGDVSVDLGREGLALVQTAPKATGPAKKPQVKKPRTGPETALDGPVPQNLARPTQAAPDVSLPAMAPLVTSGASVEVRATAGRFHNRISADAEVSVNLDASLKPALAPRPSQDFGYVFYAGRFRRELKDGEKNLPATSQVVVVVSCGFLRLLTPEADKASAAENPFAVIDFDPAHGQLQLSLDKYTSAPEVVPAHAGACIRLYSSGQPPRTWGGGFFSAGTEADEQLCGPTGDVNALRQAIDLQVRRFGSDPRKTEAWNFGTHLVQDEDGVELPQFLLVPGLETRPLSELVSEAGARDMWYEARAS